MTQRHRIHLVEKKPPRPLTERGRIFFPEDVMALYGSKPSGKPRKSRKWIVAHFAPEARHKDGKDVYWWEVDVLAWFDAQREGAA